MRPASWWPVRPLSDLVDVLDRRRVPVNAKERTSRLGSVPYYGATGQVGWIDRPLFDERLVLLGEDGVQFFDRSKPKAYAISGPAWVNNHAHVLRARADKALPQFVMHYLNWFDYAGFANGTTRLKLTQRAMNRIPVPVPDVREQRRIVDILEDHLSRLDAADELLRVTELRLAALETQTVRTALTGVADGIVRSADLAPAGVIDGPLPSLPEGWTWMRLGEFADVVGGVTKDTKKQTDPAFVEVPYLRVANVQRGHLNLSTVTRLRVPAAKVSALTLRPGDVLLNEGGDRDKLGRGWVWEGQIEGCIHQNHVFRARIRDDLLDPYLLSWAANSLGGPWCERNGKQSVNLASISLSRIRLMPVPVPPRSQQPHLRNRIELTLDTSTTLRREIRKGVTRSAALRRALLDAAFSGRLTGSAPDEEVIEEPAEA